MQLGAAFTFTGRTWTAPGNSEALRCRAAACSAAVHACGLLRDALPGRDKAAGSLLLPTGLLLLPRATIPGEAFRG